ncbi:condensation domain-containing protein [Streptomyces sp. NPDC056323]|uniref:condensation domain-containing protein n=1 Tax=Streptomyces sp. NPDC056323 TaxID=3345784 RepID=UPI0035D55DE6
MTFPPASDPRQAPDRPAADHRLTREQEAIWINDALSDGRSCYTVLWAYRLRGDVNPEAVEGALADVIHRHESLRSRFLTAASRCNGSRSVPAVPWSVRTASGRNSASGSLPLRRNLSIRPRDRCGPRYCGCRTTPGSWPFCCTIW